VTFVESASACVKGAQPAGDRAGDERRRGRRLIVRGVDPATGFPVGPDVWNVRNEDDLAYVLNQSTTVFPARATSCGSS
jgi:hypothetical protein